MDTPEIQSSDESDQQLAYTMAQLLQSMVPLFWLNLVLLVGMTMLWIRAGFYQGIVFCVAVLVGVGGLVLAQRLCLDARLFMGFARGVQTPWQLDNALSTLGLAKVIVGRSMAMRCMGALRLLRCWQYATGMQLVLVVYMMFKLVMMDGLG